MFPQSTLQSKAGVIQKAEVARAPLATQREVPSSPQCAAGAHPALARPGPARRLSALRFAQRRRRLGTAARAEEVCRLGRASPRATCLGDPEPSRPERGRPRPAPVWLLLDSLSPISPTDCSFAAFGAPETQRDPVNSQSNYRWPLGAANEDCPQGARWRSRDLEQGPGCRAPAWPFPSRAHRLR